MKFNNFLRLIEKNERIEISLPFNHELFPNFMFKKVWKVSQIKKTDQYNILKNMIVESVETTNKKYLKIFLKTLDNQI